MSATREHSVVTQKWDQLVHERLVHYLRTTDFPVDKARILAEDDARREHPSLWAQLWELSRVMRVDAAAQQAEIVRAQMALRRYVGGDDDDEQEEAVVSASSRCANCLRTHTDPVCRDCFPDKAEIARLGATIREAYRLLLHYDERDRAVRVLRHALCCDDVFCPGQDGDACHYEDDPTTGTKGLAR